MEGVREPRWIEIFGPDSSLNGRCLYKPPIEKPPNLHCRVGEIAADTVPTLIWGRSVFSVQWVNLWNIYLFIVIFSSLFDVFSQK